MPPHFHHKIFSVRATDVSSIRFDSIRLDSIIKLTEVINLVQVVRLFAATRRVAVPVALDVADAFDVVVGVEHVFYVPAHAHVTLGQGEVQALLFLHLAGTEVVAFLAWRRYQRSGMSRNARTDVRRGGGGGVP